MTWWQTLLIGTAPALVTAAALLGQQTLNARAAHALHRLQTDDERSTGRRAEVLAAHRQALARLSAVESAIRAQAYEIVEQLGTGTHERPDVIKVSRENMRAADDAVSEVVLLCDWSSAGACIAYDDAITRMGAEFGGEAPTVEGIENADRAVHTARERYIVAAKSEIGV